MKKVYQSCFKRKHALEEKALLAAFAIFSYPRMLLEVFIRKNFGMRYFSMSVAVLIFIVLFILPLYIGPQMHALSVISDHDLIRMSDLSSTKFSYWKFILKNITWYIFLGAFIYSAFKRELEIKRQTSGFNVPLFSFCTGEIHPFFWDIEWKGKKIDRYTIETIAEPLFFILISFVFIAFHQLIGYLILIASLAYSASYRIAYYQGENLILDQQDMEKVSRHLETDFVDEKSPKETEGFHLYGRRPGDPEVRRRIVKAIKDEDAGEVK